MSAYSQPFFWLLGRIGTFQPRRKVGDESTESARTAAHGKSSVPWDDASPDPVPPPDTRPTVAVVDDASQTRDTFHIAYPKLHVAGTYSTVEALLADSPSVDLVILDLMLAPEVGQSIQQGARAVKQVVRLGNRVCVYSDERRLLVAAQCFAAGASGMVRKSDPLDVNQEAFLRVAAGHLVIPPTMIGLAELLNRRARLPELTERQIDVLSARARGETWEALARRLGISPKTAYDRLEAVMSKMIWYLHDAGLTPGASPADIEHALGLAPGDLNGTQSK